METADDAKVEDSPWRCAERGDVEGMRRMLLRRDVEDWINKKEHGLVARTPFQWASVNGHLEVMQLLLSSGADVNCTNIFHETPLLEACGHGQLEVAKFLVSSGADVNASDLHRSTPLYLASSNGHVEIVKLLLSLGVNFSSVDIRILSPLGVAIHNNHPEVVKALLSFGAALPDDETLAAIIPQDGRVGDVIARHLKWKQRRHFMMFLATQRFLLLGGEEDDKEWLEIRSLSSPIHRVLMSEDLQRLLASYL